VSPLLDQPVIVDLKIVDERFGDTRRLSIPPSIEPGDVLDGQISVTAKRSSLCHRCVQEVHPPCEGPRPLRSQTEALAEVLDPVINVDVRTVDVDAVVINH
jgi:uncharacterized metal-binding protein YceD (DUF177 family)